MNEELAKVETIEDLVARCKALGEEKSRIESQLAVAQAELQARLAATGMVTWPSWPWWINYPPYYQQYTTRPWLFTQYTSS